MLDPGTIDLRSLAEALEDHSPETVWWFDPRTGASEPYLDPFSTGLGEEEHSSDRGMIRIEPVPSREAYGDMEDFIGRVRDQRARDLLERAIAGRGAFRRFKDMLLDFPDLRQAWFAFHDARMQRRAIQWLADEELVERAVAEREVRAREDPPLPELAAGFDPVQIAEAVAEDLSALYGTRLRRVLLFGSWRVPPQDLVHPPQLLPGRLDLVERHQQVDVGLRVGVPARKRRSLAVGETRAKHSGIISGFVHLLVRGGQLDEESGRLLRSLFERRNEADYRPVKVPVEEADAAIRDAERVVRAVERWLAQPRRGN
jgi:hypothetical protein